MIRRNRRRRWQQWHRLVAGSEGISKDQWPVQNSLVFLFKNQWPAFKVEESYDYILLSVHCVGGEQER